MFYLSQAYCNAPIFLQIICNRCTMFYDDDEPTLAGTQLRTGGFYWNKVLLPTCPATSAFRRTHTHTTVLRPFFRYYPGEPVPEENFWTLWCKGRLTEADTSTIRLGATPSRLIRDPPPSSIHFVCRMPFLPQPSHFILASDRHQICWLAYPVAWLIPSGNK